ncbi:MAG: TRAP transporter substrate-binding protein DctP [Myxococcales bacterium]|nr:TRAP transporter substrate-binding protein DctP [Myxococcales bacterium]
MLASAVGAQPQPPGTPATPGTPGTAPAAARVLSLATLAPAGSTWMRGLDAMNRELRRRTGNAVSFRFYPGGLQGDESEVIRKMRSGRLDSGVFTGTGLSNIYRPTAAFMLPGMFPNQEAMERARAALAPDIETAFQGEGFTILAWRESGTPRLFSTQEIRTPTQLRAAHPWQWRDDRILPALYAEVGASGVPLSLPEVLGAIQTNRVDTVVAPPLAAVALQWAQTMRFMSEGANSYGVGGLVMSRRALDTLTPEQQATLREVVGQFMGLIGRNAQRDDQAALTSMTTRGVTAVTYSAAERQQWADVFTRTRARLVGTICDQPFMDRVRAAGR